MWPYTAEDLAWFDRLAAETAAAPTSDYSPELAELSLDRARRLRGVMLGLAVRRIYDRLLDWLGRPLPSESRAEPENDAFVDVLTDRLKAPLTSIRSSSEILRDHPDLPPEERKRFIDIVLQENARLESLIGRMLDVSRFEPAGRTWHIDAGDIAAHLGGKGVSPGTSG